MPKTYFNFKRALILLACLWVLPSMAQATDDDKYMDMSLTELLDVEVSSVSKKSEKLRHVGAAIFVVTQKDIRRSGATSVPEALRMVPGLNVARINANAWAVTARGFNGRVANKLLVLIDGRSVYGDSFSGVYWDSQDMMMEDIERIEVIRGPGATLWGSNAVNGIINIITKHSIDSQGGLVVLDKGTHENKAGLRYGTNINDDTYFRTYLKYTKQDAFIDTWNNTNAGDDWKSLRAGFRLDSELDNADKITIQSDVYDNNINQIIQIWQPTAPYQNIVNDKATASGKYILGRWEHHLADNNTATIQAYYNQAKRQEAYLGQKYNTFDLDIQQNIQMFTNQNIVWGLGYRHIKETVNNTYSAGIITNEPDVNLWSVFIQDNISLGSDEDKQLVIGSKFERNDYTGWEIQPNLRFTWSYTDNQTIWASVSKAARTPTRYERYMQAIAFILPPTPPIPVAIVVQAQGNPNFQSEKLIAYELGHRHQLNNTTNFDIALFYNVYDNLLTFEQSSTAPLVTVDNKMYGNTYGGELVVNWQPLDWWQLHLAYSYMQTDLKLRTGSTGQGALAVAQGSTPKHQASLRSNMSLSNNIDIDTWLRYTGKLDHPSDYAVEPNITSVPAYTDLDVRIAWQMNQATSLALTGKNLLHSSHLEYIHEAFIRATSVERSFLIHLTKSF